MKTRLCLGLACLLLSGCSEFREPLNTNQASSLGVQPTYYYTEGLKVSKNRQYYLEAYADEKVTEKQKRLVRDRIVAELMGLIDDEFSRFCTDLRRDRSVKNIFVRTISIGLTGAAPFSSATSAKALAGIDTGLKGISESVELNAWNNAAPELLINTMRANRAVIAAQIDVSIKNKDVSEYPLEAAIRDLIAYRGEGTVTAALVSLSQQTAKKAQGNENSANLIKAALGGDAQSKLLELLKSQ